MDWLKGQPTGYPGVFPAKYRSSCRFSLEPIQWTTIFFSQEKTLGMVQTFGIVVWWRYRFFSQEKSTVFLGKKLTLKNAVAGTCINTCSHRKWPSYVDKHTIHGAHDYHKGTDVRSPDHGDLESGTNERIYHLKSSTIWQVGYIYIWNNI